MYLLDTNVLSELRRPRPEPNVIRFLSSVPFTDLFISAITPAEVRLGISLVEDSFRRLIFEEWLADTIRPMFEGRILSVTEDILTRCCVLAYNGRKEGRPWSQADLVLAATALEHNCVFVTRNIRHFSVPGISVLNPWEPPTLAPHAS